MYIGWYVVFHMVGGVSEVKSVKEWGSYKIPQLLMILSTDHLMCQE